MNNFENLRLQSVKKAVASDIKYNMREAVDKMWDDDLMNVLSDKTFIALFCQLGILEGYYPFDVEAGEILNQLIFAKDYLSQRLKYETFMEIIKTWGKLGEVQKIELSRTFASYEYLSLINILLDSLCKWGFEKI